MTHVTALPEGVHWVQEIEGITEYRGSNGLQLLFCAKSDTPTMVNLTYRVGSRCENYGETGMAHILEHMMFKGAAADGGHALGELDRRTIGSNAFTSFDYTYFYADFANTPACTDNLDWFLGWLADGMNPRRCGTQATLELERIVVRNEMEIGQDSQEHALLQETMAAMYKWHNYGNAVIGAQSDIESVDISRLRAFHQRFYRPDNASLIISGGFDLGWMLGAITKHFGPIARPPEPVPPVRTREPPQRGERMVTLRGVHGQPMLLAAYCAPCAAHPDSAALPLLANILAKRLQLALNLDIQVHSLLNHEASTLAWKITLPAEEYRDTARAVLLSNLESSAPISEAEWEIARTEQLSHWIARASAYNLISPALSEAIGCGDWRWFFLQRDRFHDLSLRALQDVAQRLLQSDNRTLGHYHPGASPVRTWLPAEVNLPILLHHYQGGWRIPLQAPEGLSHSEITERTLRFALPSGLQITLLSLPPEATQSAAAVLRLNFGDTESLRAQYALPHLLVQLLRLSALAQTDGLTLEVKPRGSMQLQIELHANNVVLLLKSLEQLGGVLRAIPRASQSLLESMRTRLPYFFERHTSGVNSLARRCIPYPPGHPLYQPSLTEFESHVRALNLDSQRQLMHNLLGADHAQLGVCAQVGPDALRQALEPHFGDWLAVIPYQPIPPGLDVRLPRATYLYSSPEQHDAQLLTHCNLPLDAAHADYPALIMADNLLSATYSSRLWRRLRDRDGLSYRCASHILEPQDFPYLAWQTEVHFSPQNRARVEQGFEQELRQARSEGFSAREMDNAQKYFANQAWKAAWEWRQPRQFHAREVAGLLARGGPKDLAFHYQRIAELPLEQVNQALRRYFDPEYMLHILIGDF